MTLPVTTSAQETKKLNLKLKLEGKEVARLEKERLKEEKEILHLVKEKEKERLKEVKEKEKEKLSHDKELIRLEKEKQSLERLATKQKKQIEKDQIRLSKESDKRQKEEEIRKREQLQPTLKNYFNVIPKNENPLGPSSSPILSSSQNSISHKNPILVKFEEDFPPFFVKAFMKLAPINRWALDLSRNMDRDSFILTQIDSGVNVQEKLKTFIQNSRLPSNPSTLSINGLPTSMDPKDEFDNSSPQADSHNSNSHSNTLFMSEEDGQAVYLQSSRNPSSQNFKLLQFHDTYFRPAYWGTWTKTSLSISSRRPFAKDESLLDYDYDSEAEWEDEAEGEDLKSEDDDSEIDTLNDVKGADGEEEDQGWLVPHGYLSDDEGVEVDSKNSSHLNQFPKEGNGNGNAKKSDSPKRPPLLQLVSTVVGPIFDTSLTEKSSHYMFQNYQAVILLDEKSYSHSRGINPFEELRKDIPPGDGLRYGDSLPIPSQVHSVKKAAKTFPMERLQELVTIICGASKGLSDLLGEAKEKFPLLPKRVLESKMKEIAFRGRGVNGKLSWQIKNEWSHLSNPLTSRTFPFSPTKLNI